MTDEKKPIEDTPKPSPATVTFAPNGVLANKLCIGFNSTVGKLEPQEYASMLAAHVAAVAIMMLENNDVDLVKRIFSQLVDDAKKQREARLRVMLEKGLIAKQ